MTVGHLALPESTFYEVDMRHSGQTLRNVAGSLSLPKKVQSMNHRMAWSCVRATMPTLININSMYVSPLK